MKSHLMLVSYQVINDEKATISLFEYDEEKKSINPLNFIVISQKINKLALIEEVVPYNRTLSAVWEDPNENDVGSFSMKQKSFNYRKKQEENSKKETPCDVNSLEDVQEQEEDQDDLLFESNFSYQERKGGVCLGTKNSYNNLIELAEKEEKKVTQTVNSNKGSMSTTKSSSGPGGLVFGDIAAQFDFMNQKYIHNSFVKTLDSLTGNISIIMRI